MTDRGGPRPRRRSGERRAIALRATLLQAAWNYETLQGLAFGWALLPGLRRLYADERERAARLHAHTDVFNSNPFLATLGLGVALRLEEQVARSAAGAERRQRRLLRALTGSLGAIGDALFWSRLRPAFGLAAAVVALAVATPWAAAAFVLAFGLVAQTVRFRGVRAGFASGAGIARVLQDPFWLRAGGLAAGLGALAAGAALGTGALRAVRAGGPPGVGVFLLAFVLLTGLARPGAKADARRVPTSLAFFAVLILLSAIYQLSPGSIG